MSPDPEPIRSGERGREKECVCDCHLALTPVEKSSFEAAQLYEPRGPTVHQYIFFTLYSEE